MNEKEEIFYSLEQVKKAVYEYFSQSTYESSITSLKQCEESINLVKEFIVKYYANR